MTVIVVEGPDGAGKSTLIDNLRLSGAKHYVSLQRSGPPKRLEEIQSVVRWIEKFEPDGSGPTPLILDRHPFISEAIYGPTLRGHSLLVDYYTLHDIEHHFFRFVDRVIYCRPPTSVIMQKMGNNPQLKGVTENIEEITRQYDHTMKLVRHWGVNVFEYDWSSEREGDEWDLKHLFFGAPINGVL